MSSKTEPTFERTLALRVCLFLVPLVAVCIVLVAYVGADEAGEIARDAEYSSELAKMLGIVRAIQRVLYVMAGALALSLWGIRRTSKLAAACVLEAHDNHAAMMHNLCSRNDRVIRGLEQMRESRSYDESSVIDAIQECASLQEATLMNAQISLNYSSSMPIPGMPIGFSAVAEDVVDIEGDIAVERGVTISYAAPDDEITVISQEITLDSLVRNLVSNAVKYTPKGGRVSVSLMAGKTLLLRRPRAILVVSDTGIGMPRKVQRRIYERNYRADWKSDIPGTGLGLSLVRSIVVPCGGSIKCKSAPGKGTTFTVSLPLDTTKRPGFIRRFLGWC